MRHFGAGIIALAVAACGLAWGAGGGESRAAPEEKVLAPGKLKLAGRAMRCGGVRTLISHTFWDYGGAKQGFIILNPTKLEGLPATVRLYVYAHECGHQLYGPRETRADCYAVERGLRSGWLDKHGMDQICDFLKDHPGDWVHPPGPVRCEKMRACYKKAKPHRASR